MKMQRRRRNKDEDEDEDEDAKREAEAEGGKRDTGGEMKRRKRRWRRAGVNHHGRLMMRLLGSENGKCTQQQEPES
eukprot:758001-Hanusia_phi.AAC.2